MLADEWSINGVPEKYSKYFDDIDEISSDTVKIMRDKLGLTWHEGGNMQDIFLISKDYHNGLSHRGGRANAKLLKLKALNK